MTQGLEEISAISLIEAMFDPIVVLDRKGIILKMNSAAQKLLGYTKKEAVGRHFLELCSKSATLPKALKKAKRDFNAAIRKGVGITLDYEFTTKKGGSIHVSLSGSILRGARNGPVNVIAVFRDITEPKRVERRLEHLNLVLQTIRNINQLIVRETDRDRLIQRVCNALTEGRGLFNAWIVLLDESNEFLTSAESGLGKEFLFMIEQLKRGELTACGRRSLTQSEVVATEDPLSSCLDCPLAKAYASRGGLTVRLEHQGKVYGIMSSSVPAEFALDEEEHALYAEVAADIAYALHGIELEMERRQAEEELEEQRQWLDGTLSSMGDAVIATDTEARVTFMNPVAESLTGWNTQEAVGRSIHEVFHIINEQTREVAVNPVDRVLKEGITVGLANHTVLISRNGRAIPIDDSGAPIRTSDGTVHGVVLVFRDISEHRKAEEEIRSLQQYNRGLIEASLDPLMTFDKEGVILDVNEATVQATGRTREELIGTEFADYFMDPERAKEGAMMVFETGEVRDYELVMKAQDGTKTVVVYNASTYNDQAGQVAGVFAAARDITERKKLEAQLIQKERLAVLGQLGAGIGYELRNPLGAIKNAAYFLRMVFEEPEPDVKDTIDIIENEVATSERIISSLLSYVRPRPPTRRKVNINDVITAALLAVPIPGGVEVVSQLDEGLPTILADPDQLRQVFVNLIMNAFQAMPRGGHLIVKSRSQGPDSVDVSIVDTGVGISQENMPKLFTPLFTTKAQGIGLGLAIVKTLVEGHGGTVEVQSELDKGTTFTIRMPVVSGG